MFWQDLRLGLRALSRAPGLVVAVVVTMGLGIGANTTIYSAVRALWLRPLPIDDPEQVVAGFSLRDRFDPFGTSLLEYATYRERGRSLASSGVALQRSFTLTGEGEPERLPGAAVSAGYLRTLGVRPVLGRSLTGEDDRPGSRAVVLLAHGLWRRRFGGDPGVVGRSLLLDGRPTTVVGVLPQGIDLPAGAEVWIPLQVDPRTLPLDRQAATAYSMIGRLAPGVTLREADTELRGIARALEDEYPRIRRGWSYRLVGLRRQLLGDLDGRIEKALLALMMAAGFLLMICCANVASLLVARGVTRTGEIAVRMALGAGRLRVARQLLTESSLLVLFGGAAAILLAGWTVPLLGAASPVRAAALGEFLGDFRIDATALAYAALLTLLGGAMCGAVPAVTACRSDDVMALIGKSAPRSGGAAAGQRWLRALVVCEIAVAVTLLVGGGLLVRSFLKLRAVDLGFEPRGLLTMQVDLPAQPYAEHRRRDAFVERVLEKARALPGVIEAGITTNLPLQTFSIDSVFTVEGRAPAGPSEVPITAHRFVSPRYLEAMDVTLVRGRFLDENDRADGLPVVVVSEELVRQAWPGENPLGRRVRAGRPDQTERPWMTVVGVVRDVKEDRFNFRAARPAWYVPYAQMPALPPLSLPLNLVVRSGLDAAALGAALRVAIHGEERGASVSGDLTMEGHLADLLITERCSALLMAALAGLGLVLAALGLYGMTTYSVGRRAREMALRIALGAGPRDILRLVVWRGAAHAGIGIGLGAIGALGLARLLAGTLYGIDPADPTTFAAVAVLLSGVAVFACYGPARRASRVDPAEALRQE